MDRKQFLARILALIAGARATAADGVPRGADPKALPKRTLGRTGRPVTILGAGGFHLGQLAGEKEAGAFVAAALEEGVRFFDTAESYQRGRSERWLGTALQGARKDVFLMTKTLDRRTRGAEGAKRNLEGSLARLRTDHLDLWQLHSVLDAEDVDRAFRKGGAMEHMLAMREKGVVRHVGVTGHARPEAHLRALEHWDRGQRFDTVQMPLNPIDRHQLSFQLQVLPELEKRGIGVIAMKTSADGRLLRSGVCTIGECLRYVWSLPVDVAVVGMKRRSELAEDAKLARGFRPLAPDETKSLLERLRPKAALDLEWYKRA